MSIHNIYMYGLFQPSRLIRVVKHATVKMRGEEDNENLQEEQKLSPCEVFLTKKNTADMCWKWLC